MKKLLFLFATLFSFYQINAQNVGIGTITPNASAQLDVRATNKGLLIPRVSLNSITDATTITSPATSLLVFNINASILGGTGIGFYTWNGTFWVKLTLSTDAVPAWGFSGNTIDSEGFIGTLNEHPIRFRINGNKGGYLGKREIYIGEGAGYGNIFESYVSTEPNIGIGNSALFNSSTSDERNNIAIGDSALFSNQVTISDDAEYNIAIGHKALKNKTKGSTFIAIGHFSQEDFVSGTSAANNVAIGHSSMADNTSGYYNTGIGTEVFSINTNIGDYNVAVGHQAMRYNNGGNRSVALGSFALSGINTGNENVGLGYMSLNSNRSGYSNTAVGGRSMYTNDDGYHNSVLGDSVLYFNTSGNSNVAMGFEAGINNTVGDFNCFVGASSAAMNTIGDRNVVVGALAYGETISSTGNTLVGHQAGDNFNMGNNNTLIGYATDVLADAFANSTALGYNATITASSQVRIGSPFVTSIGGYQNWSNVSDGRFKTSVQQNVPGLDFILKLKPVTYHLDIDGINMALGKEKTAGNDQQHFAAVQQAKNNVYSGFVAQEVEALAKKIGYNFSGVDAPKNDKDFYGLRYAEFVVPLVKAVQEQQIIIENEKKENTVLKEQLLNLIKRMEVLETRK